MSAMPVDMAEEQARLLLESIVAIMGRLEHVVECKDPDCNLSDTEVLDGLYIRQSGRPATKAERVRYHDEKDAHHTILQSYLRMRIFPDLRYELLFCYDASRFGRIVGVLSQQYAPVSARYDFQDNTVTWRTYPSTLCEQEKVFGFARCFTGYFRSLRVAGSSPVIVED